MCVCKNLTCFLHKSFFLFFNSLYKTEWVFQIFCPTSHTCIFAGNKGRARYEWEQTYRRRIFTDEHGKQVPKKLSVPEMSLSYSWTVKGSYLIYFKKEMLHQWNISYNEIKMNLSADRKAWHGCRPCKCAFSSIRFGW